MSFSATELRHMANAARSLAMDAIRSHHSGHVGIALGAADIITTVYANHLRFNPTAPDWPNRDRFVLSAGHGSALLYSVLKLVGYDLPDMSGFRSFGSALAGHPEFGALPGVEYSTGPLGQGLAGAAGMALAAKMRAARDMGPEYNVYVLCSDGDLMEGVAQEAIGFAGRYGLGNLIVLYDDNGISIDGVALTEPNIPERMAAAGFHIMECNGNDCASVNSALNRAKKSHHPTFIQCKTAIGFGAKIQGTAAAHGLELDDSELKDLSDKYQSMRGINLWRDVKFADAPLVNTEEVDIHTENKWHFGEKPDAEISTRAASGLVLAELTKNNQKLFIGGSADLAASTNTKTEFHHDITPDDFSGNFINYGVREHAMSAIMNGLCMSGFRAFGGTFLVFSDYMRPSIRLSALMGIPVIYVFSHDSIAVGEDGPTHQPVEQIASLRLIPDLNVFRPADITEVAAAWEMALAETSKPSCIILSRQKITKTDGTSANGANMGAYVVSDAPNRTKTKITLMATGSEVSLAIKVQDKLADKKIGARVVSMPSAEVFRTQPPEYKKEILKGYTIAIEAGATYAWYEFADAVAGIDSFGMGGPGDMVYRHFGFDADAIADDIAKQEKHKS